MTVFETTEEARQTVSAPESTRWWKSAKDAPPQPVKMQFTVHELANVHLVLSTTKKQLDSDLVAELGPAWRAMEAMAAALRAAGYVEEDGTWGKWA